MKLSHKITTEIALFLEVDSQAMKACQCDNLQEFLAMAHPEDIRTAYIVAYRLLTKIQKENQE